MRTGNGDMARTLGGARLDRRGFLKAAGAAGALAASSSALAACGGGLQQAGGSGNATTIKIGYVSPATGPLAPFGEADRHRRLIHRVHANPDWAAARTRARDPN